MYSDILEHLTVCSNTIHHTRAMAFPLGGLPLGRWQDLILQMPLSQPLLLNPGEVSHSSCNISNLPYGYDLKITYPMSKPFRGNFALSSHLTVVSKSHINVSLEMLKLWGPILYLLLFLQKKFALSLITSFIFFWLFLYLLLRICTCTWSFMDLSIQTFG